jgi:hypothetical protein
LYNWEEHIMDGHKTHSPKIDVRMMKREGWIDLIINE